MPHMDEQEVHARAVAIATAMGGAVTDPTAWSASIRLPDDPGLSVVLRFRTYGKAAGRCEASCYLRGANGKAHQSGHVITFDSARDPAKIAAAIRKLLVVFAPVAESIRKQWAEADAAQAELRALVGTLTDAYPKLRARMTGANGVEFSVVEDGRCLLSFGVTAGSDTADIVRGAVPLSDVSRLIDFTLGLKNKSAD